MGEARFYFKSSNAPKPNKPINVGACAIIRYNEKVLLEKRTDSNRWALTTFQKESPPLLQVGVHYYNKRKLQWESKSPSEVVNMQHRR